MARNDDDFRIRPGKVRDRGGGQITTRRIGAARGRPTSFVGEVDRVIRRVGGNPNRDPGTGKGGGRSGACITSRWPSIAAAPLAPGAGTGRPRRGASRYGSHLVSSAARPARTVVPYSQREHPMRHRRATPGRPRFPARKIPRYSNGKPACAIRCTGRTPRDRDRAALRGRPRILAKPRMPARRRWFKRWRLSDTREGLSPPVHINGENSRERCAASESWIQMTPAGGIEWVSARNGAGVVTVMRIITGLSPWSRTTVRSGWRSRAGFVNRRRYSAAR